MSANIKLKIRVTRDEMEHGTDEDDAGGLWQQSFLAFFLSVAS
jgi:hypothetical protein